MALSEWSSEKLGEGGEGGEREFEPLWDPLLNARIRSICLVVSQPGKEGSKASGGPSTQPRCSANTPRAAASGPGPQAWARRGANKESALRAQLVACHLPAASGLLFMSKTEVRWALS